MELVLIFAIAFLFFGLGKLPQVGSALGKTMKAFKTGRTGDSNNEEEEATPRPKSVRKSPKN